MINKRNLSIFWAVLAAALYAVSSPVSKLLLRDVAPTMMAALVIMIFGTYFAA